MNWSYKRIQSIYDTRPAVAYRFNLEVETTNGRDWFEALKKRFTSNGANKQKYYNTEK